jgi:hypothetical protein
MTTPEITPDMKRFLTEAIAAREPELWARCYPRIYDEVRSGQYVSVKDIAFDMLGTALKIRDGYMGANEKAEIVWSSRLASYRVPTYWLSAPMTEAIKQTTPPAKLDLREMKLPFEAAVFMLPRGSLVHETDEGEATYMSYVRTTLGDEIRSLESAKHTPQFWHPMGTGVFTVFVKTTAEHLLHWTIPTTEHVDLARLDDLVQSFEDKWMQHHSEFPQFVSDEMTEADNRFMARVCHLLFGTLLLMLARPELVTTGALRKRVAAKNEQHRVKEFWSPNIIGEHYKLRRPYIPQGGTHASPRGHWVKGSYREQPYGVKHAERKQIWVEPYWRGGEL